MHEIPNVNATRGEQVVFSFLDEFGKLADVGGVRRERERRQAFFDFQVIEKIGEDPGLGGVGHTLSMSVIGDKQK